MTRPLGLRDTPIRRIAHNQNALRNESQKPVLGGPQIYVGTFVSPGDPGNDPPLTSASSPPWDGGFTYVPGAPVWFAHGVDGETDMGGMYDLVTGAPVSGDVAFTMPLEWAAQAEAIHIFGVVDNSDPDPLNWTIMLAAQLIDPLTGEVRIYWPVPTI